MKKIITLAFENRLCTWTKWSLYCKELSHVIYKGHNVVLTRYPLQTKEMDGILQLRAPEKIFSFLDGLKGEKKSRPRRSKQKRVGWVWNLVYKFCKPVQQVGDMFSGTFSVAKGCLEPLPSVFLWSAKLIPNASLQIRRCRLRRMRDRY